jgi:hypothetical protein
MAGKRKAPETLSTNPHTVKARNRQVGMTATDLQLDKAKKADSAAVTYALGKLRASAEWQSANESTQDQLKRNCISQVVQKR